MMLLNGILTVVLSLVLLGGFLWHVFWPNAVLPKLDIPAMSALVLLSLLLEYYVTDSRKRLWIPQILLAALTFALLPWAAGIKNAGIGMVICGAAVFAVLTVLFDSAAQRMEVTDVKKSGMIPMAFVMYLACRCFMGMIL